jgi:hypothetical protein
MKKPSPSLLIKNLIFKMKNKITVLQPNCHTLNNNNLIKSKPDSLNCFRDYRE